MKKRKKEEEGERERRRRRKKTENHERFRRDKRIRDISADAPGALVWVRDGFSEDAGLKGFHLRH